MVFRVKYTATALRQLGKLDREVARRVLDHMDDITALDDPRARGKGLTGDLTTVWRYRVGDYRVLCDLREAELLILALEVGHRSRVYD